MLSPGQRRQPVANSDFYVKMAPFCHGAPFTMDKLNEWNHCAFGYIWLGVY